MRMFLLCALILFVISLTILINHNHSVHPIKIIEGYNSEGVFLFRAVTYNGEDPIYESQFGEIGGISKVIYSEKKK